MYSVSGYGKMIADKPRMEAYVKALRQSVKPDSVVVDLGSGPGVFALIACQLGARRVYAIEPDNAIFLAKEMAVANGCSNRIEFIQDFSTKVTLPERADVIISDMRGILPFFQNHIPSIVDARRRFLKPAGVLIPMQDRMWATLAEVPDLYGKFTNTWLSNPYDLDLRAGWRLVANTWRKGKVVTSDQLLVEPECWATLDYTTVEDSNVNAAISLVAKRDGTAHGIVVWFDTTLIDGVELSNAPGLPELIYGSAFFPLSEPVLLEEGDRIFLELCADLVGDDYIWRWNTRVVSHSADKIKAAFKQSTFFGVPLSPIQLRKRANTHVPELNEEGAIDKFILQQMDGETSLEKIAHQLIVKFPDRFADFKSALTIAGERSLKYSR
ncbi:MAG: 50S ribosomal protein L11 methyltransferase [Pyrinomonadaceae bacterium]